MHSIYELGVQRINCWIIVMPCCVYLGMNGLIPWPRAQKQLLGVDGVIMHCNIIIQLVVRSFSALSDKMIAGIRGIYLFLHAGDLCLDKFDS